MLKLALAAVNRGEVRIREQVPPDDALWAGAGVRLVRPVEVDLKAASVSDDSILVRGSLATRVVLECRRCLKDVEQDVQTHVDLLFAALGADEQEEAEGEVYPIPARGTELDLAGPVREQLLLSVPQYALCREECRGLCPQCGTDRNQSECDCVSESARGPWDALKKLDHD
jgi:uncharacterized protein